MKAALQRRARALGFDACRVTAPAPPATAPEFRRWLDEGRHGEMAYLARNVHKRSDPQQVLPGARSLVALAASYGWEPSQDRDPLPALAPVQTDELPSPHTGPRWRGSIARYARFTDYHEVLAERLRLLAAFIDTLGGPDTRSLWYVDTGPLLERDLAQRAGLGFVGKHTHLISRPFGNGTFLAEILTTLEFEADAPERNRCGNCVRCLDACPTHAITAPFQLDARLCLSYLTIELKGPIPVELRPALGNRIFGCDDCLDACPWNRFAHEGRLMREHARDDLTAPDLVELLHLDDAGFRRRFAATPLARTKRRGLLRNVCVALGNVGDATALPVLERAAADPEPLIAEHAGWAAAQIRARLPAPPPARA